MKTEKNECGKWNNLFKTIKNNIYAVTCVTCRKKCHTPFFLLCHFIIIANSYGYDDVRYITICIHIKIYQHLVPYKKKPLIHKYKCWRWWFYVLCWQNHKTEIFFWVNIWYNFTLEEKNLIFNNKNHTVHAHTQNHS